VAPDDVADHDRRDRCTGCGPVWRQDTSRAAEPRAKLSRRALRWVQRGCWRWSRPIEAGVQGLARQPDTSWRDGVEVVAMDGFTGFKTATSEELPDAVAVLDPFHVVRLAGDALDPCRRRVQQSTCGHRGRKGDPLHAARRTRHTGSDLLSDTQRQRLTALVADDEQVEVEATWGIYQHMLAAHREPDRKRGRELMQQLIGSISHSVPTALCEVITLGRTLKRRAVDVLAYFDRPGTPTGRPRRSTAASNTSAAQPSASATSPTTSPDRF
jgi:Transposase